MTHVCPSICLSTGVGVSQPTQPGGPVQPGGGGSVQLGGISPAGEGGGQSARGGQPGGGSVSWGGWVRSVSQGGSAGVGGGSAKIGQQNEYSLHSGRYASCVHAGGLSCYILNRRKKSVFNHSYPQKHNLIKKSFKN